MDIKGYAKNSFVDWDGKIVSVIYLPWCNFRCGFCYNVPIVRDFEKVKSIPFHDIEEHLVKNMGLVDGVVISGGEPTLQSDLIELIKKIKSLGFPVKLDTNGSNPHVISQLLGAKMIDYIAMDIKSPLEKYSELTGFFNTEKIKDSISLIMKSNVDYEFRTTIIPSIHDEIAFESMVKAIYGAKRYALQKFLPKETLDPKFEKEPPPTREYMERLKKLAEKYVCKVIIRD